MARIAKLAPAVTSAALYLAAFPPLNFKLLVFVALVPWLVQIGRLSSRGAFISGYAMGYVIVLFQMAWTQPLTLRWTGSAALSPVPWLICAFLGGFYFAILGWAANRCLTPPQTVSRATSPLHFLCSPWSFPLLWAGVEVVRSCIPALAFPWFLIASPLSAYPALIQPAYLGTIYLVGAAVVSANVACTLWLTEQMGRRVLLYAAGAVVYLTFSFGRYLLPVVGQKHTIAVGQTGVDLAFGDEATRDRDIGRNVAGLFASAKAAKADLLVLPEGLARNGGQIPPLTPFTIDPEVAVIFGGRRGNHPMYQSAFAFDGDWTYSDKTRLVVFGEYVPGRNWIPFLDQFKLGGEDLTPGSKVATVKVAGITVGPLICFEGLFWDVAHEQAGAGAQILATMSIDDWYIGTSAPEQLAMASAWRAVETGLPAVRAASLGISLAVDAKGRELARAPIGLPTMLPVIVDIPDRPNSGWWRPIFPWLAGLAWIPFLWIAMRRKSK